MADPRSIVRLDVRPRGRWARWFALPLAQLVFGVGLLVVGDLEDRTPFHLTIAGIALVAIAWHVRSLRRRTRLVADRPVTAAHSEAPSAELRDLVERLPATVYRDRYDGDDGSFVEVDYVSPHMEVLTGYPAADFRADPNLWVKLIHPDDLATLQAWNARLGGEDLTREYRIIRRDGREVWIREEASVRPSEGSDGIVAHGLLVDITERKALEERLQALAFQDALTGLPNVKRFEELLTRALARRSGSAQTAVMFLDLDGFKGVNDSLGHAAGDQLLRVVAQRLTAAVRAGDVVARLGGDEFAVLLRDVVDRDAIEAAADRIIEALDAPVAVEGRQVACRASLGLAIAGMHGRTPAELLRKADAAMYAAKAARRGHWLAFEEWMQRDAARDPVRPGGLTAQAGRKG